MSKVFVGSCETNLGRAGGLTNVDDEVTWGQVAGSMRSRETVVLSGRSASSPVAAGDGAFFVALNEEKREIPGS